MIIFNIILVIILIAITGFFVATEFAIVKVRSSRIDQLIDEGNKNAIAVKKIITNLDEYLSACQLGITITALGLGWLGEPTVQDILEPVFFSLNVPSTVSHILSFIIAFVFITFIHVVIGELAPKTFAIQKAEEVTMRFAKPLIVFYKVMYPFIKALNGSARLITGLFGLKPVSEQELAHSEEELRIILSESYKSGDITQSEYKYVNKIFEFDERIAKEVMVPRTETVAIDINESIDEAVKIIAQEKFTRYPVIDGDKDKVLGIINIKEIFTDFASGGRELMSIETYTRPAIKMIETTPIRDLLVKMQKERNHMTILIDEYGGTSGIVTMEDIVEEIVGEIRDEFDFDEKPLIRKADDTTLIMDGKLLIEEVNDYLGLDIDETTDVDTVGGWFLTEKGFVQAGDELTVDHYRFKVLEVDDYHIKTVEARKIDDEEEQDTL